MIFTHSISKALLFVAAICLVSCQSTKIATTKKIEVAETEEVLKTINTQETWGFLISPIDLWAGSTDDEIVLWHNKYFENGRVFPSKKACQEQAAIYEIDNPPSYNMEVVCVSPAPGTVPIAVIDASELELAKDE